MISVSDSDAACIARRTISFSTSSFWEHYAQTTEAATWIVLDLLWLLLSQALLSVLPGNDYLMPHSATQVRNQPRKEGRRLRLTWLAVFTAHNCTSSHYTIFTNVLSTHGSNNTWLSPSSLSKTSSHLLRPWSHLPPLSSLESTWVISSSFLGLVNPPSRPHSSDSFHSSLSSSRKIHQKTFLYLSSHLPENMSISAIGTHFSTLIRNFFLLRVSHHKQLTIGAFV